jgi:hypothetical protein
MIGVGGLKLLAGALLGWVSDVWLPAGDRLRWW